MPGFVDAHTHLVFGGDRLGDFEKRVAGATYESIAAAGGGIPSTVRATRAASETSLLESAERRLRWLIRGGTTSLEIKSGYGLTLESELKMLRVICALRESSGLRIAATFLGASVATARPSMTGEYTIVGFERREQAVRRLQERLLGSSEPSVSAVN